MLPNNLQLSCQCLCICEPTQSLIVAQLQLSEDKKKKIYDKALGSIKHWLERFDTIIIGPGLGRDEMVHYVVIEVFKLL